MLVIVNYGVGNLGSLLNMHKKIGIEAFVGSRPSELEAAERILLPGVGRFDFAMKKLEESGLIPALERQLANRKPILGICVGFQMLFSQSEEGDAKGLAWIPGRVRRFRHESLRIPHMGWNHVEFSMGDPASHSLESNRFYFAHSYHATEVPRESVVATTDYGGVIPVCVRKENLWGVQFHPEKSHRYGMQFLKNFSGWTP